MGLKHEELDVSQPRKNRRIRTLKVGRVYYMQGRVAVDCIIRDITDDGARLRFKHPFDGPNQLMLQVGFGELVQARIDCHLRWRRGNEIGVLFNAPQEISKKILDGQLRAVKLET